MDLLVDVTNLGPGIADEAVVTVTLREPADALFHDLQRRLGAEAPYRPDSVRRVGDCEAPAIIATAIYAGHRYARELDSDVDPDNRMKYDRVFYEDD